MQRNRLDALPRLMSGLLAAICISASLHAEPDVLERAAPVWNNNRASSLVITALGKYGDKAVAVGERGLILISKHGGDSWRQARSPVAVTLTGVAFSDEATIWVVGHGAVLLKSADGGENWSKLLDGKAVAALVLEAASGAGADPAFREEAERLMADGPDKPFLNIQFFDKDFGLIVGAYGLILGTRDGGATWRPFQKHMENPKGVHLYGMLQAGGEIWISGEQGALFVSDDAGEKFREVGTPYQGTWFGIARAGENLVAYGMRGNAWWSPDRGRSWQKSEIPTSNSLTGGYTQKNGVLVLVDDGGHVFASSDGGRKFQRAEGRKMPPLTSVIELSDKRFICGSSHGIIRSSQTDESSPETNK